MTAETPNQTKEQPKYDGLVTVTRLAQLFGVNKKTIHEWRKVGKDVPEKEDGKENLQAWGEWFAANPDAGYSNCKPSADKETLQCEKIEVEIAIKKLELNQRAGELISIGDAKEAVTRITSEARAELLKMTSDLPPILAGLPEPKIHGILRETVIDILQKLSIGLETIHEQKAITDEEDDD
jgi:phage terminase Nu1 subunit (DNA packaging protein)